jgi:hypothetical protein
MGWFYWLESHGYRSNFGSGVEKLRRNGISKYTQEILRQRPIVSGSKGRDHPPSNLGVISTVGSREVPYHWIGGQVKGTK